MLDATPHLCLRHSSSKSSAITREPSLEHLRAQPWPRQAAHATRTHHTHLPSPAPLAEEHWGRHWRVIPLTEPEGDSELEDSSLAGSEGWGEGGELDEGGFEAKPYHCHRARSFLEGGSEGRGYDEDELSSSSEGSDRGRGDAFTLKRKPQ